MPDNKILYELGEKLSKDRQKAEEVAAKSAPTPTELAKRFQTAGPELRAKIIAEAREGGVAELRKFTDAYNKRTGKAPVTPIATLGEQR